MWANYSAKQAAEFVGLPESSVRACARTGILSPGSSAFPMKLSFRDVTVLRKVRSLSHAGLSMRRIKSQLQKFSRTLPQGTSLAEYNLQAVGGHVAVRNHNTTYRIDNGQLLLCFQTTDNQKPVTRLVPRCQQDSATGDNRASMLTSVDEKTDQWFDLAVSLEDSDTKEATAAYQQALAISPDHVDSWINLGRLLAEEGNSGHASHCFRKAIEINPHDSTAVYNLAVVAQDAGRDVDAVKLYKHALIIDPNLAEAHYNLATIFDREGNIKLAIRHINEYRRITKKRPQPIR